MNNEQLCVLARKLVDAAEQQDIVVRMLGGAAVLLACESASLRPGLRRNIADVDFVTARRDFDRAVGAFKSLGLAERNAIGNRVSFEKDGMQIELADSHFYEDFSLELSARLTLHPITLPLADLTLIKLQRKNFAEKDIKDTIALLLDHRVALDEAEDQISSAYIAQMTRGNWGRFHTVYDNTVTLEKILPKYIDPEEAQLVWRRIEVLQGEMDRVHKSVSWLANQIFRKPTEIAR